MVLLFFIGCKSGLGALLQETRSHLVVVHCLAHRLELSFKDAIKSCQPSLYTKCMTLLIGLFYLYHKSQTQKKALQRSFASLEMKQVLPTRVGGTRWLPHTYRAITVLIKGKFMQIYIFFKCFINNSQIYYNSLVIESHRN